MEFNQRVASVRDRLMFHKGYYEKLFSDHDKKRKYLSSLKERTESIQLASVLIQNTAKETQDKVKIKIDSILTSALQSVFTDHNYTFELLLESRRGVTVITPIVYDDGNPITDLLSDSGGLADLVAFALRIALLIMSSKDRILIIDEPFKHMSDVYIQACGEFLHELAHSLDLQIIMPTHITEFGKYCDTTFVVKKLESGSIIEVDNDIHIRTG